MNSRTLALAENVPLAGSVTLFGRDVVRDSWAVGGENLLGHVPQEGGLFEFMTVAESVELLVMLKLRRRVSAADLSPDSEEEGIVPPKYLSYPVHALSGGTKKKLLIRLADVLPPGLQLLDECTTGVDPIAAERIMRHLRDQARRSDGKQALLFASHRIDESLAICDRVLMLSEGQVFLDGPIARFSELAARFFQLDVLLNSEYNLHSNAVLCSLAMSDSYIPLSISLVDFFVLQLANAACSSSSKAGGGEALGHKRNIERVVSYSSTLVRVTFEKRLVPISSMYAHLSLLREQGLVLRFSFRAMDLEEVLATVIAATREDLQRQEGEEEEEEGEAEANTVP